MTTIAVHSCSVQGTTANVFVAGSDPISYEHNKMAVYRHDDTGLLQDVTLGTFVDGDSLTPITGKLSTGSYYSAGHSMADILRRQQSNINKDIASGKISGPSKVIDLIAAPPVQEDVNLTEVMRAVNNQYKTLVNAWSILEEESQLESQSSTASAIPNRDADSNSPSPLGFDATLSPLLYEGEGDANSHGDDSEVAGATVGKLNTLVGTASPPNLHRVEGDVDVERRVARHDLLAASGDGNTGAPHHVGGVEGNPDVVTPPRRLRDQLTQDIVSALEDHSPASTITARDAGNAEECRQAFLANFPRGSVWKNFIQLTQAVNFLGDMYGFTTRLYGCSLICGCGKNHKQTKGEKTLSPLV